MKKKLFISMIFVLILVLTIVAAVSADIKFLTSDGIWGQIDDGYDGVRLDVVGVVGVDPGSAWGSGSTTTQDDTLIRNPAICTGDFNGDATLAEWTGISPAIYTNLGSHTITIDYNVCPYYGIFISEYVEGVSGGIDAIEIYNNLGEDVILADCPYWIGIFSNGSDRPTTIIPLTGTITDGSTYVVASGDITGVTEDLVTASLSYDGDDAVALISQYVPDDDGETDGATSNQWASGPPATSASPLGGTIGADLFLGNDPTIQLVNNTDWNQVRYGNPAAGGGWANQSGLSFLGTNNTQTYGDEVPFLVGKFCHVNHPITVTNNFLSCPLEVDLYDMDCGPTAVEPFPPPKLTFTYPVSLDETPNSTPCTYPSDPGNPCADRVNFSQSTSCFHCFYQGDVTVKYTVSLLGFMHLDSAEDTCENVTYVAEQADGTFISQEGATNCGCLFAMITESFPTAVELVSFEANSHPEGIQLEWVTASEVDNLGFNLYRAEGPDRPRTQVNPELIPSQSPGGTAGAEYTYLDTTVFGGKQYFYWLEDIDLHGQRAAPYGPTSALDGNTYYHIFMPILTTGEVQIVH